MSESKRIASISSHTFRISDSSNGGVEKTKTNENDLNNYPAQLLLGASLGDIALVRLSLQCPGANETDGLVMRAPGYQKELDTA